jgi:anaerobic magnesium-protoporphyrin IX monomethyl ester cyclase
LKIKIVSVDDTLVSIGARRVAAQVRRVCSDTSLHFVIANRYRSFRDVLLARDSPTLDNEAELENMAAPLADADIVAFSAMTHAAPLCVAIARCVRRINPRAFLVWGGIHPIIAPDHALRHMDAICVGEGERAFSEFIEAFANDRDYTQTRNFWFNTRDGVLRNPRSPLLTTAEMEALPLPWNGDGERLYRPKRREYTALTPSDYLRRVGTGYLIIWSLGCPLRCSYCCNSRFIENDRGNARLRYPRPQRVIDEILAARRVHTHIGTIVFEDDSLMALPLRVLEEFAAAYRRQVGVPFYISGIIPNYVRRDKLEVLLEAGLNRVRMGIQSGSERTLRFYGRPTPPARILAAARTLTEFSDYMIPPAYDFILDNPAETRADVLATLDLVHRLPRPFTCNLFSLRVQPNTRLAEQFRELGIQADDIHGNYLRMRASWANCLLVLLVCTPLPRWLFDRLRRNVRAMDEPQRFHPLLLLSLRLIMLGKRAWHHFRRMDFSVMPGRTAELLSRLGVIRMWQKWMPPMYRRPAPIAAFAMLSEEPEIQAEKRSITVPPHLSAAEVLHS